MPSAAVLWFLAAKEFEAPANLLLEKLLKKFELTFIFGGDTETFLSSFPRTSIVASPFVTGESGKMSFTLFGSGRVIRVLALRISFA